MDSKKFQAFWQCRQYLLHGLVVMGCLDAELTTIDEANLLLQCSGTMADLGANVIRHWPGAELVLIAMHGAAGALPPLWHSHAVWEGLGCLPRQLQLLGKREPFNSAAPCSCCLHVHQPCQACKSCAAPCTGMFQCVDDIRVLVRVLTATVCCLQLLSSIYANKVTAYLNGHDHSMTVGNPQQANVTQEYAAS